MQAPPPRYLMVAPERFTKFLINRSRASCIGRRGWKRFMKFLINRSHACCIESCWSHSVVKRDDNCLFIDTTKMIMFVYS